jgi:surface carbohydrate biosynthesis protein (TIGR04326 family)
MSPKFPAIKDLALRKNLSYWWMTPLAQKSNFSKSPQITEAIRLIAFDKWSQNQGFETLEVFSSNVALKEVFQDWCITKGIDFVNPKFAKPKRKIGLRSNKAKLIGLTLKSLVYVFKHLLVTWNLRKVGLRDWKASKGKITFASYLFNLDTKDIESGQFRSPFWAHLPDELITLEKKTNWIHIYVRDSCLPNAKAAAKFIKRLNANNKDQVHVTLDSFMSFEVAYNTLRDTMKLRKSLRVLPEYISRVHCGNLNLWTLFENEWNEASHGPELIQNVLTLNEFESAFESLQEQNTGIYLFEQQPWEMALISAWKSFGHQKLVAAQHSTMLYWDLRYFHDARTYEITCNLGLPLPDVFAFNGKVSSKISRDWGYPDSKIREVEALRYFHLLQTPYSKKSKTDQTSPLKLLILGDYLSKNTDSQMEFLQAILPTLPIEVDITIRPHPASPISSKFEIFLPNVSHKSLSELIWENDAVFVGPTTSAAIDAYCCGKPVITLGNSNTLNLNPLRGFYDSVIVYTPSEFTNEIIRLSKRQSLKPEVLDIFNLDYNLHLWKSLLMICKDKSGFER